nr:UTP--glucose-1-phosphate uridylyltransferase [Tanacetum cinerariifolium]
MDLHIQPKININNLNCCCFTRLMEGDDTVDTAEFFEEENKTNKKHNEWVVTMDTMKWFNARLPAASIEPVSEGSMSTVKDRKLEDKERWWNMGLEGIADGRFVVSLLSDVQDVPHLRFWMQHRRSCEASFMDYCRIIHVTVETMSMLFSQICFATCFDTNTLDELRAKEGKPLQPKAK